MKNLGQKFTDNNEILSTHSICQNLEACSYAPPTFFNPRYRWHLLWSDNKLIITGKWGYGTIYDNIWQ